MALPAHSLVTLDEVKEALEIGGARAQHDDRLERIAGRASRRVATYCRRELMYAGTPYTEYHSPEYGRNGLWLRRYPVTSLTTVHESWSDPPAYDAATLLASTEYVLAKGSDTQRAKLYRLTGVFWAWGLRKVRVVYAAGWPVDAKRAAVPQDVKDVTLRLCALIYREETEKQQGTITRVETGGATTRFPTVDRGGPTISGEDQEALQPYVCESLEETGEVE